MGDPALLDPNHRWNDRSCREAERHELNRHVDDWLGGLASRDEALALLQANRVPCGPVLGIDEVAEYPELRAARAVRIATDPILGQLHVPGFSLHFSQAEAGFDTEAPHLGEHNAEVLTKVAGGPQALARLEAEGVVHHESTSARPSRHRRTG